MHIGVNALFLIPGDVGGSETYLLETLQALRHLPQIASLTLFTNRENHAALQKLFPDMHCVMCPVHARSRPLRIFCEQFVLPKLVRKSGVDILWSPGYTVPIAYRGPQVVTILDMQYKRFPEDVSWLAARTMDILYPAAARRSCRILTISQFAKQDVVHYLGVPDAKVRVTPLAADPVFGQKAIVPLPEGVESMPYLLCVSHTYPHKNVAALVEGFSKVANLIPHRLVLVGQARRGEAEVARALRACPEGRVLRFQGLSREVLIGLYQRADWFVLPSLYEGFGLPVLEALMAGTPVLTTCAASLPEVGGDAVFYAEQTDAHGWAKSLQEIVAMREDQRAEQIARGHQQAALFSWEKSAQMVARELASACAHQQAGSWMHDKRANSSGAG